MLIASGRSRSTARGRDVELAASKTCRSGGHGPKGCCRCWPRRGGPGQLRVLRTGRYGVPSRHAVVRRGHVSRNCKSPVAAIDASSLPRLGIQYDDVRPGTWHLNLHNARRARGGIVNIVGDQPTHHRPLDVPLTADSPLWQRRNLDVSVVGALMIGAMSRFATYGEDPRQPGSASTVRSSRSCRRRLAHEARPLRPRLAKVHRERASGERPCSTTGRRA